MEQVFRIEIPVEAVDKTDASTLQNFESVLQKLFNLTKDNKTALSAVFDAIEKGASEVRTAVKQAANEADNLSESFEQVADSAEDASGSVKLPDGWYRDLNGKLHDASGKFATLGKAASDAGQGAKESFKGAGTEADKFTRRMQKSEQTLRGMFKEKLQLTLAAIDRASPILKSVATTVKGLTSKAWHIAVRMKDFVTAPFRKLYSLISSPITMALSIVGVGFSARDVVDVFDEFESGMSAVKALTGATGDDFLSLKQTAKDLGASTSFSASEASQGMQYLAMAGWNTNEIIAAMPGLLDLAAAGATDLGTAADIVSDVMTAMGMSASKAGRAADVFAKSATSSNTTIEGLGNTMKYAAPIAYSFGMTLEDVATAAALMGNAGIKGEMAGTALRSSLLRMSSPTTEMASAMKKLGISFSDSSGKMKNMKEIVRMLDTSFGGLSESEKLAYAQNLFGTEAASAWLGIINQGADAYNAMADSLYNCEGAAKQMANIRLDNLAGDLEELGGAVETAKIELMEKLSPYLRQEVRWLTGKIPVIQQKLEKMIDSGIEKFGKLKNFLGDVFNSSDFQNADGFAGKFFVAWDKIIAEPFTHWWNGDGQNVILGAVEKCAQRAGELLHGIVLGIFAAIRGEEIDLEGLNITGLAKAGLEAARSFITAFKDSLDIGGLLGDMPGLLQAGLFGVGAVKVVKGVSGIAQTISALKTAFTGTTAAAVGTKAVLSSLPGVGWLAAAALSAVAVGIGIYTASQRRQRDELINLEKEMRAHTENYRREADEINRITDSVQALRTIEIKTFYTDQPSAIPIQDTQTQIAVFTSREEQLRYQIDKGGTDEELATWQAELAEIGRRRAEADQRLAEQRRQVEDVIALVKSLNQLGNPDITATLTIEKTNLDGQEDVALIDAFRVAVAAVDGVKTGTLKQVMHLIGAENVTEDNIKKIGELSEEIDSGFGLLAQALSLTGAETVTPTGLARVAALSLCNEDGDYALRQELSLLGANRITDKDIETVKELSETVANKVGLLWQTMGINGIDEINDERLNYIDRFKDVVLEGTKRGSLMESIVIDGDWETAKQIIEKVNGMDWSNADRSLTIHTELTELGLARVEIEALQKMVGDSEKWKAAVTAYLDKESSLTAEEIDAYVVTLSANAQRKVGIGLQLTGASLTYREIATLRNELTGIQNQIDQMAPGDDLTALIERKETIELMLEGVDLTAEQIAALSNEFFKLQHIDAEIYAHMADRGMDEQAIKEVADNINRIGDKDAMITVTINRTEVGTEEAVEQERQRIYDNLAKEFNALYGTNFTAEMLASGRYDALINSHDEEWQRDQQEAQWLRSKQSIEEDKALIARLQSTMKSDQARIQALQGQAEDIQQSFGPVTELMNAITLWGARFDYKRNSNDPDIDAWREKEYNPALYNAYKNYFYSSSDNAGVPESVVKGLFGSMDTPHEYLMDILSDGDENALTEVLSSIQGLDAEITRLKSNIEAEKSILFGKYTKYKQVVTDEYFIGSSLFSQPIEAIAAQMGSLADADRERFVQALSALTQWNRDVNYIDDADKTHADELLALAQKSELMQKMGAYLDAIQDKYGRLGEVELTSLAGTDEEIGVITAVGDALAALGGEPIEHLTKINDALDYLRTVDMSAFSVEAARSALLALSGDAATAKTYVDSLRESLKQLDVAARSHSTYNGSALSTAPTTSTSRYTGGEFHAGSVASNATGGIYDHALLSWVAEDGPEAIIPLSAIRRTRGLELWRQTGEILGASEFTESGISAPYSAYLATLPEATWSDDAPAPVTTHTDSATGSNRTYSIHVSANPVYQIEGTTDTESILTLLKSKQHELAELIGESIADQLDDIVSNMT